MNKKFDFNIWAMLQEWVIFVNIKINPEIFQLVND